MRKTVKARKHHGSNSLDITIPAEFVKNYKIKEGDVFSIEIEVVGSVIKIIYKRVYQQ